MPQGYGPDLRDRVISAVEAGVSARSAAARFDVGVATAIRWVRRWRETGSAMDPPRRSKGSVLDPYKDWLLALRRAEPDLTLRDVSARLAEAHGLTAHQTTIWYFYRRCGISFKKNSVRR